MAVPNTDYIINKVSVSVPDEFGNYTIETWVTQPALSPDPEYLVGTDNLTGLGAGNALVQLLGDNNYEAP